MDSCCPGIFTWRSRLRSTSASERPPQLVSGNAGTALDDIPTASPIAGELGDPAVTQAETLSAFGFMTLEPDDTGWVATQRDKQGNPLLACELVLDQLTCETARCGLIAHPESDEHAKAGDLSVARFAPSPNRQLGSD